MAQDQADGGVSESASTCPGPNGEGCDCRMNGADPRCPWRVVPAANVAEQLASASRSETERAAAAVLREVGRESFRRHRNPVTATREASQLVHLATRLEGFADADAARDDPSAAPVWERRLRELARRGPSTRTLTPVECVELADLLCHLAEQVNGGRSHREALEGLPPGTLPRV